MKSDMDNQKHCITCLDDVNLPYTKLAVAKTVIPICNFQIIPVFFNLTTHTTDPYTLKQS